MLGFSAIHLCIHHIDNKKQLLNTRSLSPKLLDAYTQHLDIFETLSLYPVSKITTSHTFTSCHPEKFYGFFLGFALCCS